MQALRSRAGVSAFRFCRHDRTKAPFTDLAFGSLQVEKRNAAGPITDGFNSLLVRNYNLAPGAI